MDKIAKYGKALAVGGIVLAGVLAGPSQVQAVVPGPENCDLFSGSFQVCCNTHHSVQLDFDLHDNTHSQCVDASTFISCLPRFESFPQSVDYCFTAKLPGCPNDQWVMTLLGGEFCGSGATLGSGNTFEAGCGSSFCFDGGSGVSNFSSGGQTFAADGGAITGSTFSFTAGDPLAVTDGALGSVTDNAGVPEVDPTAAAGPVALALGTLLLSEARRRGSNQSTDKA